MPDAYDPADIRALEGLTPRRHRDAHIVVGSRDDLLYQALAFLPEGEHADIISLLDAGEWAEAAHQMRGGPGDRAIPAEAHALIDRAMA